MYDRRNDEGSGHLESGGVPETCSTRDDLTGEGLWTYRVREGRRVRDESYRGLSPQKGLVTQTFPVGEGLCRCWGWGGDEPQRRGVVCRSGAVGRRQRGAILPSEWERTRSRVSGWGSRPGPYVTHELHTND